MKEHTEPGQIATIIINKWPQLSLTNRCMMITLCDMQRALLMTQTKGQYHIGYEKALYYHSHVYWLGQASNKLGQMTEQIVPLN